MDDRKLAVITPLVILVIMIAFTQTQIVPVWLANHRSSLESSLPDVANLQLLGYNFNKDLVQVSVTLWNRGTSPIVITDVYYDNVQLAKGTVGSPTDTALGGMSPSDSSSLTSNEIIFPATDQWNMLTGGGTVPVIRPNGIVTLYLGVTSTVPGSAHFFSVIAGNQEYVFQLQT